MTFPELHSFDWSFFLYHLLTVFVFLVSVRKDLSRANKQRRNPAKAHLM